MKSAKHPSAVNVARRLSICDSGNCASDIRGDGVANTLYQTWGDDPGEMVVSHIEHGPSIGHLMQFVVSNALRAKVWLAGCFASAYGMSTISAASTFSAPGNTGHNVSTSIYRGWRTLTSDVQVQDGVDKRTTEDRRELPPVHLRRSQPVVVLLPRTRSWLASLPEPVRPHVLAAQFARIANLLCTVWDDPSACKRCFYELLVDRRGGRRGFSIAVLRELNALSAYYIAMHDAFDRSRARS